jgi:hypothetical protein
MKKWLSVLSIAIIIIAPSCKNKKTDPEKKFVSAVSYFNNQVADVDTSLYSIIRLDFVDSIRTDTTYVRREAFREQAKDFLELPDISGSKYIDDYTESTRFDDMLNSVVITYTPKQLEKAVIQRQEILIKPDPSGDKVKSIIIDYLVNSKDSIVQKRMLWQVDRSFQVTTIRQLPGQEETISTKKVIWNEPENL